MPNVDPNLPPCEDGEPECRYARYVFHECSARDGGPVRPGGVCHAEARAQLGADFVA